MTPQFMAYKSRFFFSVPSLHSSSSDVSLRFVKSNRKMPTPRINTLVIDFSVLPTRPDPSVAEDFVFKKVKLELKDAKCIQFHNVDRRFYIQMVDKEKPLQYERAHHLKHTMLCAENKIEYHIPVFYLDGASTVRIHDLPPMLPHSVVVDHMRQYGKVVNINYERWKNYFGGTLNGVRVLRIHLSKSIPSYLTIAGSKTLCTHSPFTTTTGMQEQIKTCIACDAPVHANSKCKKKQQAAPAPQQSTQGQTLLSKENFPSIESGLEQNKIAQPPREHKAHKPNQQKQPSNVTTKAASPSELTLPNQREMELGDNNGSETDKAAKRSRRTCSGQPTPMGKNCAVVLSDMEEDDSSSET